MENISEIPNVLACDVGNSTIQFAHVKGEKVLAIHDMQIGKLANLGQQLEEIWQEIPEPKKIVASSVNDIGLKALEAAADETINQSVLVIGRDVPLPIETELKDPDTVGVDRICAAAAAFDKIGTACVIADFGTAITIDCVNDKGVFLGGAILPGLDMSADSLNNNTSKLPRVEIKQPEWTFGKTTEEAIVGGLVFGAHGALREFTEAYATELGSWPTVIITGGDAKIICPDASESELVQAIVPDLVLRGVAIAYYKTLL